MKIQPDNSVNQASVATVRTAETRSVGYANRYSQNGNSTPASGDDEVRISDFASKVAGSDRTSATAHASRVQEIARLYQAGKYTVDSNRVSSKLVDAALARSSSGARK